MANKVTNLTPKQQHFCRAVVSGCTMSDAYREAYNTGNMKPGSIHREASLLMSNPMVSQRVQRLQRQRDRAVVASSLTDRERVLEKLRHFMDHAEPGDGAKVRATELLGKSVGLFKDVVETKQVRTVEEVEQEIQQRLAKLGLRLQPVDAESEEDTAEPDPDAVH